MQSGLKRSTVKDLLAVRRQQKLLCCQERLRPFNMAACQSSAETLRPPDATLRHPPPLRHLQPHFPPLGAGPAPLGAGPAPLGDDPAPLGAGHAPLGAGPAPQGAGPASLGAGPAPLGNGPAPLGSGSPPLGAGPAPLGSGPAPLGSGPAPMSLFQWQIQQQQRRLELLRDEELKVQDDDGDTFLHVSVAQGKRALSFVLAEKMSQSGSVDLKEHHGQTALHVAAVSDQHLIASDLLRLGAQIETRDFWGRTPLHVCAEKGHVATMRSIWSFLSETGRRVDVDMLNYEGATALHTAVLSHNAVLREARALKEPCVFMTRQLCSRRRRYEECVRILLLMGAACGAQDMKSGRTSFHMAAEEGNMELLQLLLQQPTAPSIVNAKTFSGNTALHLLCSLPRPPPDAVRLLLRRGADPDSRNGDNEPPWQLLPDDVATETVRQMLRRRPAAAAARP